MLATSSILAASAIEAAAALTALQRDASGSTTSSTSSSSITHGPPHSRSPSPAPLNMSGSDAFPDFCPYDGPISTRARAQAAAAAAAAPSSSAPSSSAATGKSAAAAATAATPSGDLSDDSDSDSDPYADVLAPSTSTSSLDSSAHSTPSLGYQRHLHGHHADSTPAHSTHSAAAAPPPPPIAHSAPLLTGTLTVRVIGARKLFSHSPKHFMSPFCMVSLPPFLSSTASHDRGDLNPRWDQQFVIKVQDCPVDEMFVCSVWDEKRRDDGLALLDIEIGKLMNALYLGRHWFPLRHPTRTDVVAGDLELDVQWSGNAYEWPDLSPNPADFRIRKHKFAMVSVSDVHALGGGADATSESQPQSQPQQPVRSRDFRASDTLHPNQMRAAGANAEVAVGAGATSTASTATTSTTTTTQKHAHLVDNRTGLTVVHEYTVPDLRANTGAGGTIPPLLHQSKSFGVATMGPCGPGVAHVPLPDQTFTLHDERHLSSFLPPDTSLLSAAYGADHSVAVHSSARFGLIYDDTTHFDDRNFLQHQAPSARIVEVRVWSREYIHGVQLVYKVGHEYRHTPRYMGKVHTTMHRLVLSDAGDEDIIAIRGTYKEWLETLTIVTNKRWKTFGGNVENRPKRWLPPGSDQAPVKFDLSLPAGHRVLGFFGGYGVHLHNIGVSYVPIVQNNSSRFGSCIVNVLRHKLARLGSVEFNPVVHDEGGSSSGAAGAVVAVHKA